MRMRYERRDPRPEDLRQIDELKSVVDSQEKDIFYLTEQLRELQLDQQQQQQMQNHQIQTNLQNTNQSKKNKGKGTKTNNGNKNIVNNNNENSNNNEQQQMRHQAMDPSQQTKQIANHDRDQHQRMKPPPLIKTIIYEEENEIELYEQQLREEREHAKQNQDQEFEAELQSQQNGITVELMPESPDYTTKNGHMEEFSEAHIISDHEIMNNVPDVVAVSTPTHHDKNQEIRVEVISTIEPAHIQIVPSCNGCDSLEMELD